MTKNQSFNVYRFIDELGNIIYVGKTISMKNRMRRHFTFGHISSECYDRVVKIEYIELNSKTDMDIYELYFINKYNCEYNIKSKNDDTFDMCIDNVEWKGYPISLIKRKHLISADEQIRITMNNIVLKGGFKEDSYFSELGEKGLAICFLLLQRMSGQNITWITINSIMMQLGLQRRDKVEVVRVLNYLISKGIIVDDGTRITDDIKNNDELEFEMETDFERKTYTTFYPNNFIFCKMIGIKYFTVFCMIESFAGTNKEAFCSIETLSKITNFSNNTIIKAISVMEEIGIYDVEYGSYNESIKKNSNNTYISNAKGRIELLERSIDDVKKQINEFNMKCK